MLNSIKEWRINDTKALAFILTLLVGFGALFVYVERKAIIWLVISIIINYVVFRWNKKNLSICVFSFLYFVTVPVQLAFSIFSPESIQSTHWNDLGVWVFDNNKVVTRYFLLGTFFFLISTIISLFVYSFKYKKKYVFIKGNVQMPRTPEVLLIIYVVLYSMSVHLYNGYIDYFLRGVGVAALGCTIVKAYYNGINFKSVIYSGFMLLIYAIPGLIFGRRSPLVLGALMIIIYCYSLYANIFIKFVKKHKNFLIVLLVLFLVSFGLINLSKLGEFNPVHNLFKRITGMFDGVIVLNHLETQSAPLTGNNFFSCAISDSGMRANMYYTRIILDYPYSGTAFAAPIFVNSLLYGKIGWFLIISFYALIISILCKKIQNLASNSDKLNNFVSQASLFIFVAAIVNTIMMNVLDGNIEILKLFTIPVFAFVTLKILVFFYPTQKVIKNDIHSSEYYTNYNSS